MKELHQLLPQVKKRDFVFHLEFYVTISNVHASVKVRHPSSGLFNFDDCSEEPYSSLLETPCFQVLAKILELAHIGKPCGITCTAPNKEGD